MFLGCERTQNVADIREGVYCGRQLLQSHDGEAMGMSDNFPEVIDLPGFADSVKSYQAQLTKLG